MSSPAGRASSVAVDIGGTFTDVVVFDKGADVARVHKVPTTPPDVSVGMMRGLTEAADLAEMDRVVHGTTVGLNAFLARTGSRTLVVITHPFRDLLHLGRAERTDIWRLDYERPAALLPLTDVVTVRERVRSDGSVIEPLEEDELEAVASRIREEGIESVAVCFLHSCRNPAHELRVRELLKGFIPELNVALSHEVASEVREYERFATTLLSAYIAAPITRYLARVDEGIREKGYSDPLFVMRSSGGVTSAEIAERAPIQTLLSGPAGGVAGAERIARELGRPNLIAIDMGGTSLDASLIVDGRMARVSQMTLEAMPVLMPVVDLVSIGAGGGSIAWVELGGLRVGPKSAGAVPGPACYGLGGKDATVTDANVLLGLIDPDYFLGGEMKLDVAAAETAIGALATQLDIPPMEVAQGIVAVTNARMADALRSLTIKRGHDPREFSLLVFGGAGPLHGAALADELEIGEVIVPQGTGVFSAWGMLHAPVRHDVSLPLHVGVDNLEQSVVENARIQLEAEATTLLERDGVMPSDARYDVSADMRYVGQEFFINVEGAAGWSGADWASAFQRTYHRVHGHSRPEIPSEIVNLRIAAQGKEGPLLEAASGGNSEPARRPSERLTFVGSRRAPARVIQREELDEQLSGPAIIEEAASTTFVPPHWTAQPGERRTIVLTRSGT